MSVFEPNWREAVEAAQAAFRPAVGHGSAQCRADEIDSREGGGILLERPPAVARAAVEPPSLSVAVACILVPRSRLARPRCCLLCM